MAIGALIAAMAFAAEAASFLANGSFDDTDGRSPYQWQVFLAPMEGAEAALDDAIAFEGEHSVRIHVPEPYPREPYNNWSQNVMRPLAGERVVLSAAIRTESATRAEVWVQCFARSPLRELRRFSTADEGPVYGTKDWSEVSMTIDIPAETDFLTVRCVLTGTGTAWFDAVSLTRYTPPPLEGVNLSLIEPPDTLTELEPDQLEFVEELLKANKVLLDTVRELRDSNAGLSRELTSLQGELRAIRDDVASMRTRSQQLEAEALADRIRINRPDIIRPDEPLRPVPPLVPVDHELATRRPPR